MDKGSGSGIFPDPDPGDQKKTGSDRIRIRIRNTGQKKGGIGGPSWGHRANPPPSYGPDTGLSTEREGEGDVVYLSLYRRLVRFILTIV